jgi:hypothetical protein
MTDGPSRSSSNRLEQLERRQQRQQNRGTLHDNWPAEPYREADPGADRGHRRGGAAATAPSANALKRRDTMWLEVFIRPNEAIAEVSWKRICAIIEAPLRLPWPRSAS